MAAYGWSCATGHAAWTPRDGAQLVSLGGDLLLLGGWNTDPELLVSGGTSEVCSEVWRSADDGRSWTLATNEPGWSGRHCMGAVVHDDQIYIIGAESASRPPPITSCSPRQPPPGPPAQTPTRTTCGARRTAWAGSS